MRVSGSVRFGAPGPQVYAYLARSVLAHALNAEPDDSIDRERTILTRYTSRVWLLTVVTTEEATLEPGRSITWRHVDGPLSGSVETFGIRVATGGGTVVRYEGEVRARNRLLRGPLEWLFVAPLTRLVSMRALKRQSGHWKAKAGGRRAPRLCRSAREDGRGSYTPLMRRESDPRCWSGRNPAASGG